MSGGFSDREICDAIAGVEKVFPFENYISEGKRRGAAYVIKRVARFFDHGNARLLDIGSGPMDLTACFSRIGYKCFAADDLSDPWHRGDGVVDKILRFAQDMDIAFHLQSPSDYTIPFEEASFDVVTVNAVIEHLHESPRDILKTAMRFLKPGGILCVTMPNSVNLRKRLWVLTGSSNYPPVEQFFESSGTWRGHVREYTLAETVYICKKAGCEILESTTYEQIAFDRFKGPILQIYLSLCGLVPTFRSSLCVIGRKPRD